MKKIVSVSTLILTIISIWISHAITTTELQSNLNSVYENILQKVNTIFNTYNSKINIYEEKLSKWDYSILTQLTWIEIQWLKDSVNKEYSNLVKNLIENKYSILTEIDTNENKFKLNLITTWDYETKLNDIATLISWYHMSYTKNIKQFENTLSGLTTDFDSYLQNKYNYYKDDIIKYKTYIDKLNNLTTQYNNVLINKHNQLNEIIWASKNILQKKSKEIKNYVTNYFSGILYSEYKKYLQKEKNITYFSSWFELRKQVLIWFVDNKLSSTIENILNNYYPDIDLDSIKNDISKLNNKTPTEITKKYNQLISQINSIENIISDYITKIDEKLQKFDNSTDSSKILHTIQQDILKSLDETSKIVKKEVEQTLNSYLNFIKTRKQIEEPMMQKLLVSYNKYMYSNTLTWLNELKKIIQNYKPSIILPENLEIINKYVTAINQQVETLKYSQINTKINELENKINNLKIWDNSNIITQLSWELSLLYKEATELNLSENIINQIQWLKTKLQIKENMTKLFNIWAISYYYQYGDLTETVANILMKYYKKYKDEWKENVFMDKIKKAFDKLQILEENLSNDMRTYYIIMIHNGLLKFKYNLLNQ